MILGDTDLKHYIEQKRLIVNPLSSKCIRENGLDLTIDNEMVIENKIDPKFGYDKYYIPIIDSHNEKDVKERFEKVRANFNIIDKFHTEEYFIIQPKSLNLLSTQERVEFPDDLMGFCALRSSVARHGFICPMTIVDAGFKGTLTIEVIYAGIRPFKLYVGDRFLHLIVAKTSSPVKNLYNGIYSGQNGVRTPKCID